MRKKILLLVIALIVIGGGVFLATKKSDKKAPTQSSNSTQASPNSCKVLTAAKIKELVGFDVDAGASKPSSIGGSTCAFQKGNGVTVNGSSVTRSDLVIFQIGDKKYATSKAYYPNSTDATGIGTNSFYQTPTAGNANAQATKGNWVVLLTLYSQKTYTADQVKSLLSYVVNQL